jgi:ribonuclease HI
VFQRDFLAVADGSSKGNGAANEGYGSYVLSTRGGRKGVIRLDMATATNGDPEYQTPIAGLNDMARRIARAALTLTHQNTARPAPPTT